MPKKQLQYPIDADGNMIASHWGRELINAEDFLDDLVFVGSYMTKMVQFISLRDGRKYIMYDSELCKAIPYMNYGGKLSGKFGFRGIGTSVSLKYYPPDDKS